MAKHYSPDTKAAVMAALLEGQSVSHVAEEYKVPRGTVSSWKKRQIDSQDPIAALPAAEKRVAIGGLLHEYLQKGIATATKQLDVMGDPEWLHKQGAAELATNHGVLVDKMVRLLEAFSGSGLAGPDGPQ